MGTSQSSSGAPSNAPLVPPWTPPPPDHSPPDQAPSDDQNPENPDNAPSDDSQNQDGQTPDLSGISPISSTNAPSGRFGSTRLSLGDFAKTGADSSLKKGVGRYISDGLGGARTASQRLASTSRKAGKLYGTLSNFSDRVQSATGLSSFELSELSTDETMAAVVEAVCPIDGTQDAEASRHSISEALSEVLDRHPDADLSNLSEEQKLLAVENYIALDIIHRFDLDVGKHFMEKAPSVNVALTRFREVKEYIKESVSAAFRNAQNIGEPINENNMQRIAHETLQAAFSVFEEYV